MCTCVFICVCGVYVCMWWGRGLYACGACGGVYACGANGVCVCVHVVCVGVGACGCVGVSSLALNKSFNKTHLVKVVFTHCFCCCVWDPPCC